MRVLKKQFIPIPKVNCVATQSSDCININLKESPNMNELFHNINKMAKASKVKKTRNTNQYAHISPVQPFTQQSSSFSRLNYKIPQSHQKFTRSSHDIRPETLINSLKVSQNKLFEKGNMNNWKEQIHLDFGQGSMIKRIIPQR